VQGEIVKRNTRRNEGGNKEAKICRNERKTNIRKEKIRKKEERNKI
jgi:hypothetical protein